MARKILETCFGRGQIDVCSSNAVCASLFHHTMRLYKRSLADGNPEGLQIKFAGGQER